MKIIRLEDHNNLIFEKICEWIIIGGELGMEKVMKK